MRAIGKTDNESRARTFSDALVARGIESHVEHGPDGLWVVYVHAEDHIDEARAELDRFLANPDDPAYASAAGAAEARRRDAERADAEYRRNQVDLRGHWYVTGGAAPLTVGIAAVCVAVSVWTSLGQNGAVVDRLFIGSELAPPSEGWLPEVRHGEVWRLITPLFIHFGLMHLIFNMWWFWDLGRMIELRRSALTLAALVLVIGLVTNLADYAHYGPATGGMSGVVYGLFGYVWIRGRYDPGSGLFAPPGSVSIMLVWLFLCMTGFFGPIANVAHGVGLVLGAGWGFISAKWLKKA
jgi:GlpG protein